MFARVKNHALLAATSALISAQTAMAQGDMTQTVKTKIASGWLPALITAGLAMLAVVQVVQRWTSIFEGNDVFKHMCVIGSLIGLTIWWKDIVGFILTVTN